MQRRFRKGSLAQSASTKRSTNALSCTRLSTNARLSSLLISLKRGICGRSRLLPPSAVPFVAAACTIEVSDGDDDGGGGGGTTGGGSESEPAADQSDDAWLLCARTAAFDCCNSALRMKTGAALVLMT